MICKLYRHRTEKLKCGFFHQRLIIACNACKQPGDCMRILCNTEFDSYMNHAHIYARAVPMFMYPS